MFLMNEQIIGATVRQLRSSSGLTLTALAKKAGLTKSTLSKIENGQVSSPIATLMRLADGLDVPLAELFAEPPIDPPYVLTRKGKGQVVTQDGSRFGYSYEGLALEIRSKSAEPFLLTIRPNDGVGQFKHGGEEFLYMLSGRMRFTVGQETFILTAGDSLYFDPRQTHTTKALGKTPARFICIFMQASSRSQVRKR
jgi:transcriptional regulator with XRE-family HTH domain